MAIPQIYHRKRLKVLLLVVCFFSIGFLFPQEAEPNAQVPPPPCYANGNNGFGGAVGEGLFLASDPNSVVQFNMSTGGNTMNDILVLYFDTGATGRTIIDSSIDDSADEHRIAISNSNVSGFGSDIQFPLGFEATYALAINTNFGGLWEIPSSGTVGNNGLNFITALTTDLTSPTQGSYQFSFDWADIGLMENESFSFVGVYVSSTGFSSDEGYGSGITPGTAGSDNITFDGYLSFPQCNATLSENEVNIETFEARYFGNELHISGIQEDVKVRVYDILGKLAYSGEHKVQDAATIPIELSDKQLYFIVIQSSNQKEVIKVVPN